MSECVDAWICLHLICFEDYLWVILSFFGVIINTLYTGLYNNNKNCEIVCFVVVVVDVLLLLTQYTPFFPFWNWILTSQKESKETKKNHTHTTLIHMNKWHAHAHAHINKERNRNDARLVDTHRKFLLRPLDEWMMFRILYMRETLLPLNNTEQTFAIHIYETRRIQRKTNIDIVNMKQIK